MLHPIVFCFPVYPIAVLPYGQWFIFVCIHRYSLDEFEWGNSVVWNRGRWSGLQDGQAERFARLAGGDGFIVVWGKVVKGGGGSSMKLVRDAVTFKK